MGKPLTANEFYRAKVLQRNGKTARETAEIIGRSKTVVDQIRSVGSYKAYKLRYGGNHAKRNKAKYEQYKQAQRRAMTAKKGQNMTLPPESAPRTVKEPREAPLKSNDEPLHIAIIDLPVDDKSSRALTFFRRLAKATGYMMVVLLAALAVYGILIVLVPWMWGLHVWPTV